MATFQPANFNFGQNIVEADLRRQQIAAQRESSARSAALQARAQDIAQKENEARRDDQRAALAENARQFDARMAESAAARDESARQFDSNIAFKNREYADKRSDIERAQTWEDAIKMQQMENLELEFEKRNEELDRIMSIRQEEDLQRLHQQEMIESAYGNAVIATELGGGFLSKGQVDDFNARNGTQYNYVGKIDPSTGSAFSDGKIHFVTYAVDKNTGAAQVDPNTGRPVVYEDNPIGQEFYGRVMDGYFGKYKNLMNGKSSSGVEIARINAESRRQAEEGKQRRFEADREMKGDKFAYSVARDMNKLAGDYLSGLPAEQREAAKREYADFVSRFTNKYGSKPPARHSRQVNPSSGDNRGNGSSKPKLTREEAIRKLLATGKYKLEDGKVVPK